MAKAPTSFPAGAYAEPKEQKGERESGLCILRIHDIFSAYVVWFTFIARTQEHRAVGSSGLGLTRLLWAIAFGFCRPSPLEFIVSQTFRFVNTFFNFFLRDSRLGLDVFYFSSPQGFFLISLHPYCITTWAVCQEVFQRFLKDFFTRCHLTPCWCLSALLTFLSYHILRSLSRGLENFFKKVLRLRSRVIFRLTFTEPLPLDIIIIPWIAWFVKCFF